MLKKLFKYDFKAVMKYWWIAALSSVALSLLGGWCISVFASEKDLPETLYIVATLLAIISVLGIIAFIFLTTLSLYTRFYKNFFTDEGYLTFTLPVKLSELINSKLMNNIVFTIMTAIVVVIDLVIALYVGIPDIFSEVFLAPIWEEFVTEVIDEVGAYFIIFLIEAILIFVLFSIFSTLFVYMCVTISSIVAKKAKLFTAIIIYYVANSVFTFVFQMFYLFGFETIGELTSDIPLNMTAPFSALLLLLVILFLSVFCTVLYTIQYWMLDRKLNLS